MPKPTTQFKPDVTETATTVIARSHFLAWLVTILLALVTMALYWPATRGAFINFDDPVYVSENIQVQNGLTLENVKWAFLNPVSANWHPLTMLSHMLDCQLFGLKPWGHHLINVLFHAFNAAMVFALLRQLTGAMWRSLLVAALFAVHPLRVESVAWIAERKDVLSGFFGLLTLFFYARHAQRPGINLPTSSSIHPSPFYWFALFFFALGLMSKAMLVTLPCVLLLLDYWPLERFKQNRTWQLVIEKIPFFALTVAASIATFVVQKQGGATMTAEQFPLGARVGNAVISYCRYLGKTFWPTDMAIFYPHPGYWPLEKVLLAGVFLGGISVLLFMGRRRYPFLLMGWLWFIGTLVPVIGLAQVGEQAMADRYTYIPSIGLWILTIWGGYELIRRWRYHVIALVMAGSAAIILCLVVTRLQLGYWKDSETLFRHALAVTESNGLAHNNLGIVLLSKGQTDEAINQFQEVVRLKPAAAESHENLGNALLKKNQTDEAINQFQEAVRLKPDSPLAHRGLGNALFDKGQIGEAISEFRETIRLEPDSADAHVNLGVALLKTNQTDEAINQFQEAIRLKIDNANARYNLGITLLNKGQTDKAISEFRETIRLKPDDVDAQRMLARALELKNKSDELMSNPAALNNLAWKLATSSDAKNRDGTFAVKLAERACEQTHYRETVMIGTLAAAYAEAGRFDDAILTGQKACARASELGETDLLKRNQELLSLYQAHQPYHEPPANSDASQLH
jgi:protein O-mannosyl-transferase